STRSATRRGTARWAVARAGTRAQTVYHWSLLCPVSAGSTTLASLRSRITPFDGGPTEARALREGRSSEPSRPRPTRSLFFPVPYPAPRCRRTHALYGTECQGRSCPIAYFPL